MDSDELRSYIKNFSFDRCKKGNQGFSRILIQLFGLLGHGKSSFINTCIYVWKDCEFQNWSKSIDKDGGHTTERIPYKLTENITLVDNRGCNTLEDQESGVIFAQLGNLLPIGTKVDWEEGYGLAETMVKAEKQVKTSDFVFPVFVHSIRKEITEEEKENLKALFLSAQKLTGVVPIVVLTHKTAGTLTQKEGIFRDIGVERIFSFENYTREDHLKTRGKHEELLKFLCEVIKDVQFRVEQPRNPSEEMKMRRKFVLSYVNDWDKMDKQRKVENKKVLEQVLQQKKHEKQGDGMKTRREGEARQQEEEFRRQQQELQLERDRERERHEEMRRQQQELQLERDRERDRHAEEMKALQNTLEKKKKKKKFLGLF